MFDYAGPVLLESAPDAPADLFLLLYCEPAVMAKADDTPNERWITLSNKGKGGKEGGAVHVKIRVGPDGSGHVVSGPGELRGLHLTRLASPEELAKRREKRDAERLEARKAEKEGKAKQAQANLEASAKDPALAQKLAQDELGHQKAEKDKATRLSELGKKMYEKKGELLKHAAELTEDPAYASDRALASIDPELYEHYKAQKRAEAEGIFQAGHQEAAQDMRGDDPGQAARGAGAVIASRNVQQIRSGLDHLRRSIVSELVRDPELKMAVMGDDPALAIDAPSLESGRVNANPGYARATEAQAQAASGFTRADAKDTAERVFNDRMTAIAAESPKRADAIEKMRNMTLDRAVAEREVKTPNPGVEALATPAPVRDLPAPAIQKKAALVRAYLKTHEELKALEREERKVRLGDDPEATPEEKAALAEDRPMPPGAELGVDVKGADAAFSKRLDAEVQDAAKADLTRAFLDSIDDDEKSGGQPADLIRRAMTRHIGVGAHAHLANVALATLGNEGLDRQVVDTLGVEASAQLLAHALRRDAPERLGDIREGLNAYHDNTSTDRMTAAVEQADAARADAAAIDLPPISGATDAALVMSLNNERKARIEEAHEALGTALGEVEAGAALNLALAGDGTKDLHVRFGNASTAGVALQLRALGLQDGDYALARSAGKDGTLVASITPAGQDRLTRPLSPEDAQATETVRRIKSGAEDEKTYLPAGFEARSSASFDQAPALPPAFESPPDFTAGVRQGVSDAVASRVADGWQPSELYGYLQDAVRPTVSGARQAEFDRAVHELLPVTAAGPDGASTSRDLDARPEVQAHLQALGDAYLRAHHPGEASFHARSLPDDEHTREATFRTLAANPALAAAFSPPGDLGTDGPGRTRANAIKEYFTKHLAADLPGGPAGTTWADFVKAMHGTASAYAAVQGRMQSEFMQAFQTHYAAVTGQTLPISKRRAENGDALLAALHPARVGDTQEARAGAPLSPDAPAVAGLSGKAFSPDPDALHGGEVTARQARHLQVAPDERYTLGNAVEGRLSQLVRNTPLGINPGDSPVGLIKDMGWGKGTKHVGKQRGVKILLKTGRLLGFYGAGSGKTAMQIGGFTQANAEGKARKGLFVCPSIVRNQFGEEAARMTTPGKYSWHAHDDTFEGRKKAYSDGTSMVVVTHATFRDDAMKLMAETHGVTPGVMAERFEAMDRPARAAAYKKAMDEHKIPMDYLSIDEAHDFLNRAGKPDSLMSHVAEAALDNHRFKSVWTGSPVKNDSSEIADWLEKLDPKRFPDREAFARRYGVNTVASQEALKRLMDSYAYVDSTRPNIKRKVVWGAEGPDGVAAPLALTPEQQAAYQGVHDAFTRASRAQRNGSVDVEAAKLLSPNSFQGVAKDGEEAVARGLQSALGTLKYAALGRVVNEFPAEHNAKIQHVLKLAAQRPGQGGVIFARNRASVAMLKEQLEKAGRKVGVIDGSTSTEDKGRVRTAFDRGDIDIVVASDAGATGANLQKRGQWLVNYDLPLTQKTLEQRNARIDRMGQGSAIELHHLQTATPYDTDNVHRLEHKRELGEILQGEFKSLDDTGLGGYLTRARAERAGDGMESWQEPLSAPISEDAKPAERKADVPAVLPSQTPEQAKAARAALA